MNHLTMPQNDFDCPSRIFRVHFFRWRDCKL